MGGCHRSIGETNLERGNPGFEGLAGGDRLAREGGGIWAKTRKPSRRGSVFANESRGASRLGKGNLFGGGVGRGLRARRWGSTHMQGWGDLSQKSKNQAAGARFLRTNCGGCHQSIEETSLWRGKPGLRGWEVEIGRRARVGGFWPKSKNSSRQGLVFVNASRGGSDSGSGVLFGVG